MRLSPPALKLSMKTSESVRQLQQELSTFGTAGVDGARELVAGERVVHGVAVPGPIGSIGHARAVHRTEKAQVRNGGTGLVSLRGGRQHPWVLDPYDLGSEVGEQQGGVGTRPHGRHVDDADPAQGRRRSRGRHSRLRRRRLRRPAGPRRRLVVVLAQARSQAPERPTAFGQAARWSGKVDRPRCRVIGVPPESALRQVVRLENLRRRVHAGQRPPAALRLGGRLGPGARQQPRIERRVHRFLRLASLEGIGTGERRPQGVVVEDVQELSQLLRRRHHRHVAVRTGMDPARNERLPCRVHQARAGRAVPVLMGEQRGGPSRQRRQGLQRGTVDEAPRPRRLRAEDGRQGAQGRHVAHQVEAEMTGQPDRTVVAARADQGIAHGLHDQVRPGVLRVRAGGAEAADAHDREPRPAFVHAIPGHAPGAEPPASRFLYDQMRAVDEAFQSFTTVGRPRIDHRAALVGVQVHEGTASEQAVRIAGDAFSVA